jgi:hypothetical protein
MTATQLSRVMPAALIVLAVACSHDEPPGTPLGAPQSTSAAQAAAHALIGPAALAVLDTGNAYFKKKDYPNALAKYRAAADLAPQHSAPVFGIYMVAKATSNATLADSALAEIRKRNGPLPEGTHATSDTAKVPSFHGGRPPAAGAKGG